jgi:hypothetical protein
MSNVLCQIGRLGIVIVALIVACAATAVSQFEIDHTLLRADTLLTRDHRIARQD